MVFYRKYRPQTLDELIGQASVKQSLKSAILSNNLSHAYLFCGPRGTGKTSTARILAKIVNCEQNEDYSKQSTANSEKAVDSSLSAVSLPCNTCPSCISITNGSNLDVIEMDAASNRGIEDIRLLRDNIKLAPTSSKKKVYIIDEVHMLTGDAFNALLKTLEEPPSHVIFILATTEVQKIPITILSRVQKLDFKLASSEEVMQDLKRIIEKEKLEVTEEALLTLANRSGGSFRDAEKLLDQLSSQGKVDLKQIEKSLGTGSFEEVFSLINYLAQKQVEAAILKLLDLTKQGVSIKEINLSILNLFRQLLLIKNNLGEELVKTETTTENFEKLQSLARQFVIEDLIKILNIFQTALEQSRFVSIPTLPLEVAIVESCMESQLSAISYQPSDLELSVGAQRAVPEERVEHAQPLQTDNLKFTTHEDKNLSQSLDIKKITDRWSYILETVKQYNFSLEALLRSSKVVSCDNKIVTIEVPYAFHQRILEAPRSKDLLESILVDILERPVKITTVLGVKPVDREELANIEVAQDDEILRIAAEIFNGEVN